MFGGFDYNWVGGQLRTPEWLGEHNILVEGESMWAEGDHELLLTSNNPAREKGLDLSQPFLLDGEMHEPLPGMNPGYFTGSTPDLGAIQFGQSTTTFVDVPLDHWAHDDIEVLYQEGYIAGCNADPLMYCPEDVLTRAESAVFIERGIHTADYLPDQSVDQIFADVLLTEWFAKWSHALWNDGYTAGCGTDPLIYCPFQEHTRAEASVFFLRMMHGSDYVPPEPVGLFVDVPLTSWYADWAEAAYDAGIIPACQTTPQLLFCPDDPLD